MSATLGFFFRSGLKNEFKIAVEKAISVHDTEVLLYLEFHSLTLCVCDKCMCFFKPWASVLAYVQFS